MSEFENVVRIRLRSLRTTLACPWTTSPSVPISLRPRSAASRPKSGRSAGHLTAGRVRLLLGERDIVVEAGEAAEIASMAPHAVSAFNEPAELIMTIDGDGQRAHVHHESGGGRVRQPHLRTRRARTSGSDAKLERL